MDKSLVIDDTRRKTFCSKGENQQQINSTHACMASSLPRYQPGPHFLCQPLFLFPLKPTYTPKKTHFNITQVSLYFIFYAFKLSTWQGLIQLNIPFFFLLFPGYSFNDVVVSLCLLTPGHNLVHGQLHKHFFGTLAPYPIRKRCI